jgi:hypothetical protein
MNTTDTLYHYDQLRDKIHQPVFLRNITQYPTLHRLSQQKIQPKTEKHGKPLFNQEYFPSNFSSSVTLS